MRCLYTTGKLTVREGSTVVKALQVRLADPRATVDRANAILSRVRVTGHTPADWKVREQFATDALLAALGGP